MASALRRAANSAVESAVLRAVADAARSVNPVLEVKRLFLDRQAVRTAADRGKLRAMTRYGAILRRVAQTSMKYRKGSSPPGTPPSAHKVKRLAVLKKAGRSRTSGALLRELLYFAYDPATKSVVVGPVNLTRRTGKPTPALHEFGGSRAAYSGETIAVKNKPGKNKFGRMVSAGVRLVELKGDVRYPKRPFMAPALAKTVHKYPEQFRGVVTG